MNPQTPQKTVKTVNYDLVADGYNKRYETAYKRSGIASKLLDLVHKVQARRVLEVGCGTGHWLSTLRGYAQIVGMDLSFGMLQKAADSNRESSLVRGGANNLPFGDRTFDMVFCVNAFHHFGDPPAFVAEAHRLLTRGGVLAVIGMNPHTAKDRWFIYDYFPGTREMDLQRYPSPRAISDWMMSTGFEHITHQVAERLRDDKHANDILPLPKDFTSQLSLLASKDYEKGIARMEAALRKARGTGDEIVFPVDISLSMVTGWMNSERSREE